MTVYIDSLNAWISANPALFVAYFASYLLVGDLWQRFFLSVLRRHPESVLFRVSARRRTAILATIGLFWPLTMALVFVLLVAYLVQWLTEG